MIAALQTVVAYLFLTRTQEESTRRQTETEKVSLQRHNELLRTRDAVIFGLAGLADCRDPETGRHLERIRHIFYAPRIYAGSQTELPRTDYTFIR